MSTIAELKRRVDTLTPSARRGEVTVTHTGDLEEVWYTVPGRRPARVKALRGISMEDL